MPARSSHLVNVLAQPIGAHSALFLVHEPATASRPANGGLRILPYRSDAEAVADGYALCERMRDKHRLYNTGFSGAKLVARTAFPGEDKTKVLAAAAEMLQSLNGVVYTGCDLNVSLEDAGHLAAMGGYVLAGLGSDVDPSVATARGVAASMQTAYRHLARTGHEPGDRVLVHGAGATGQVVARRLASAGFTVLVTDLVPERARIPGCINISSDGPWWDVPHDVLVLCSGSGILTRQVAEKLSSTLVVSAANAPFAGPEVVSTLAERDISWVLDPVSNAGAVIVDSIEQYAPQLFFREQPESIYTFVEQIVGATTACQLAETLHPRVLGDWLPVVDRGALTAGERFAAWLASGSLDLVEEAAG